MALEVEMSIEASTLVFIIMLFLTIILCVGEPDIIDGIVHQLMKPEIQEIVK